MSACLYPGLSVDEEMAYGNYFLGGGIRFQLDYLPVYLGSGEDHSCYFVVQGFRRWLLFVKARGEWLCFVGARASEDYVREGLFAICRWLHASFSYVQDGVVSEGFSNAE